MPDTVESGQRGGKASGVITLLEWAGNLFLFGLAGFLIAKAVAETGGESEGIKALAQTPLPQDTLPRNRPLPYRGGGPLRVLHR